MSIFSNTVFCLAGGALCGTACGLIWRRAHAGALTAGNRVFFAVWTAGILVRLALVVAAFAALCRFGVKRALLFSAALAVAQAAALAWPCKHHAG
ncbi:MAG: hypothetical protein WC421_00145 [Elusimicrobiales bacterium]